MTTAAGDLDRVLAGLAARGAGRMVPDRTRITALLDLLGDPQRAYPSIHITGTNGKTSTARMIDALLRSLGLRTGRYTSPHLASPTERISLDGEPLSDEVFARAYDDVAVYAAMLDAQSRDSQSGAAGGDPVTYFELLTAMGFAAFADAPVDVAVLEVGMGGEWDATNVVQAPVCVITPVELDHRELGETVAEVATEKAGIIHSGAIVVAGAQSEPAAEALLRRAAEVGATIAREGIEFGVAERRVAVGGQLLTLRGLAGRYDEILLPLYGRHMASNAAYALAAVECFVGGGTAGALDLDAVREAFASVTSPGRLEVVRSGPTVLLDGAHNTAGARALAAAMADSFSFGHAVGVVGVLADKDVEGILDALEPVLDEIVVTRSTSPRAMDVDGLAAAAVGVFGADRVSVETRLDDALDAGIALAEAEGQTAGAVLVTGSLTVVGEARTLLGVQP